jgi:opacity protein-like surface antigen
MKRLITTIALTVFAVPGAFAADMAAAPQIVHVKDWSGFYAGFFAGYGRGGATDALPCGPNADVGSVSVLAGSGPATCGTTGTLEAITALHNEVGAPWNTTDDFGQIAGWLAGARLGYNKQIGVVVLGAELGGSASTLHDDAATDVTFTQNGPGSSGTYTGSIALNWLLTATAKLGYALNDSMLVSLNGGLAMAEVGFKSSAGYSDSSLFAGWTAGAELEYRLTDNVSITADYRYVNVPNMKFEGASLFGVIDNVHEYSLGAHSVTAGLNYHF